MALDPITPKSAFAANMTIPAKTVENLQQSNLQHYFFQYLDPYDVTLGTSRFLEMYTDSQTEAIN